MLQANKLARRAMVWAQTPLLTHVRNKLGIWLESRTQLSWNKQNGRCKQLPMQKENSLTVVCHFGRSSEVRRRCGNGRNLRPRCRQHWYWTPEERAIVPRTMRCSNGTEEVVGRWTHSAAEFADCMTKGSGVAQNPFEFVRRKNWRWRQVYYTSFTSARKRHNRVMMSWTSGLQRWMKLWIFQGCTVHHANHIGGCQSTAYVQR